MQTELTASQRRIRSVDLLRGLVMVIMALDHTRDFFHKDAFGNDPLDLSTTTPILFFTRWITHFCAPVFVFLSGMSAWFQSIRKSKKELSRFLISRGLWLILVEIFVMTLGITGDIYYGFFILQTIWAIGISMVILGIAIWLPFSMLLLTGLIIVLGHNILDFIEKDHKGTFPWWWYFLHIQTVLPLWGKRMLGIFYPFLPWTGLMMVGYCSGRLFTAYELQQRNKILLRLGVGILIFFVALRFTNLYGDPDPWSVQKNSLYTMLSFVNVRKYPPSLLYMSLTIGVAFIFLAFIKGASGRISKIIIVFGRVPFFYYIIHFYLLHLIAIVLFLARGHSVAEGMAGAPGLPFKFVKPGEGFDLPGVYIVWILVVMALYPLCKWYDNYKTKHREKWWLSYL